MDSRILAMAVMVVTTMLGLVSPAAGKSAAPTKVEGMFHDYTADLDASGPRQLVGEWSATLKGGTGGVTDIAGNALAANYTWSFTTEAPPPDEGPGGPILVITSAANPFSRYYAEILRAEGFNAFWVTDMSQVSAATLSAYDVAILGEMPLTSGQVTMLTDWVNAGGRLIAMRPDKQLAALLGLSDAGTILFDAYLLVNTASGPGVGIVSQTVQFHSTADRYSLNGATAVAPRIHWSYAFFLLPGFPILVFILFLWYSLAAQFNRPTLIQRGGGTGPMMPRQPAGCWKSEARS